MDLNDRNLWLQPEEPTKQEIDFWFKFDEQTQTFILVFNSATNQVQIHLTNELMEKFMDESLAFFIDNYPEEDDENSFRL